MSRIGASVLAVALAVLSVLPVASASAVNGYAWEADEFRFDWRLPPAPGTTVEAAYRVYDPSGRLTQEATRPLQNLSYPIPLPPIPGVYTLEAWFQNESGEHGPHTTVSIPFDNEAPPPPLLQSKGWVMGIDGASLGLAPPGGPLPLAGIAGYAVSTDRGTGSSPCARQTRCDVAELDVGTAAGGSAPLGILPEGINFVRAVTVSGSGVASAPATAEVRVDSSVPRVALQGVPSAWSNRPVRLAAIADDGLSGMQASGLGGPFTAIAVNGRPPTRAPGNAVAVTVGGNGIHRVEYFARDAAGNIADGVGGAPPPASATVRIDEDPPRVAFAPAQDPAEPERIEAFVSDSLAGPSEERGWIGVRPAGSRARFEQLPTRIVSGRLVAHWDSDSYPPGKYEFLATGFDRAGNSAAGGDRLRGGRMVLVNPLKRSTALEARLHRRDSRLAGRLRTLLGVPAAGEKIEIVEVFARGSAASRRITSVRTDADGKFATRLAAGPSREVFALFAGSRTLTRATSEKARLELPTAIRFRASAASARIGGRPVVFSGRVRSVGVARVAGLPVELQFRFRGSGWREFRTVETDARGRFRYPYRFSDDDSRGVRFQFRAYVKGRERWPYEPGSSRPVAVLGR
jgi:5-hydroxyisourate hydrolase-like protein (transthyretin family)